MAACLALCLLLIPMLLMLDLSHVSAGNKNKAASEGGVNKRQGVLPLRKLLVPLVSHFYKLFEGL